MDRSKDYIRRRGENVSSFEIEAEVGAHAAVAESAAVAAPSLAGEDDVRVFVVLREDSGLTPVELIEFLVPRLPYFAIPRYITFIDQLPKAPTNKVQKAVLQAVPLGENMWDRKAASVVVPRSRGPRAPECGGIGHATGDLGTKSPIRHVLAPWWCMRQTNHHFCVREVTSAGPKRIGGRSRASDFGSPVPAGSARWEMPRTVHYRRLIMRNM